MRGKKLARLSIITVLAFSTVVLAAHPAIPPTALVHITRAFEASTESVVPIAMFSPKPTTHSFALLVNEKGALVEGKPYYELYQPNGLLTSVLLIDLAQLKAQYGMTVESNESAPGKVTLRWQGLTIRFIEEDDFKISVEKGKLVCIGIATGATDDSGVDGSYVVEDPVTGQSTELALIRLREVEKKVTIHETGAGIRQEASQFIASFFCAPSPIWRIRYLGASYDLEWQYATSASLAQKVGLKVRKEGLLGGRASVAWKNGSGAIYYGSPESLQCAEITKGADGAYQYNAKMTMSEEGDLFSVSPFFLGFYKGRVCFLPLEEEVHILFMDKDSGLAILRIGS